MDETFCLVCQRVTYIQLDAERYCPVCSSPLIDLAEAGSETG